MIQLMNFVLKITISIGQFISLKDVFNLDDEENIMIQVFKQHKHSPESLIMNFIPLRKRQLNININLTCKNQLIARTIYA